MSRKRAGPTFDVTREQFMEALRAAGDAAVSGTDTIREAVPATLQDPRTEGTQLHERISECVSAIICAVRDSGGHARDAVRGVMLGAAECTRDGTLPTLPTIEAASAVLVRHAIEDHESLAPFIQHVVESAIEAACELGFNAEESASAAAQGALDAAAQCDEETRRDLVAALPKIVNGIVVRYPE